MRQEEEEEEEERKRRRRGEGLDRRDEDDGDEREEREESGDASGVGAMQDSAMKVIMIPSPIVVDFRSLLRSAKLTTTAAEVAHRSLESLRCLKQHALESSTLALVSYKWSLSARSPEQTKLQLLLSREP